MFHWPLEKIQGAMARLVGTGLGGGVESRIVAGLGDGEPLVKTLIHHSAVVLSSRRPARLSPVLSRH